MSRRYDEGFLSSADEDRILELGRAELGADADEDDVWAAGLRAVQDEQDELESGGW